MPYDLLIPITNKELEFTSMTKPRSTQTRIDKSSSHVYLTFPLSFPQLLLFIAAIVF